MKQSQIVLKLILDETGVGTSIETVADRKAVQKAVYLAQAAGVDLGYHYNWYLKGPYSPALTRDYYPLADALGGPLDDSGSYELNHAMASRIDEIKPALVVPGDLDLGSDDWLELLASLHFLLIRRKQSFDEAKATLKLEKPHIAEYADRGLGALESADLITSRAI